LEVDRRGDEMKIRVELFAILKDIFKTNELWLDMPLVVSSGEALTYLRDSYPGIEPYLYTCALAKNGKYINRKTMLSEGDEIALIPAVSGG